MLCGRQASDDDQGVVPALLGELLGLPVLTLARAVEVAGTMLRVTRVTADGDEIVEGPLPAVVTISSEIGVPRFPNARAKMAARKAVPVSQTPASLGLGADELRPVVVTLRQLVPAVSGNCEFLQGSAAETARELVRRLRADGAI